MIKAKRYIYFSQCYMKNHSLTTNNWLQPLQWIILLQFYTLTHCIQKPSFCVKILYISLARKSLLLSLSPFVTLFSGWKRVLPQLSRHRLHWGREERTCSWPRSSKHGDDTSEPWPTGSGKDSWRGIPFCLQPRLCLWNTGKLQENSFLYLRKQ